MCWLDVSCVQKKPVVTHPLQLTFFSYHTGEEERGGGRPKSVTGLKFAIIYHIDQNLIVNY